MPQFNGRLQGPDLEPSFVHIDINDGRFRISRGRIQVGSWPLAHVTAERTSPYRFNLDIAGETFEFTPDDPSTFSDSIGAVVDLREHKGRFGLKARIEQVTNS